MEQFKYRGKKIAASTLNVSSQRLNRIRIQLTSESYRKWLLPRVGILISPETRLNFYEAFKFFIACYNDRVVKWGFILALKFRTNQKPGDLREPKTIYYYHYWSSADAAEIHRQCIKLSRKLSISQWRAFSVIARAEEAILNSKGIFASTVFRLKNTHTSLSTIAETQFV